jgi:hypothetical protein
LSTAHGSPCYSFLAEGASRHSPVLVVEITPTGSESWCGEFFGGADHLTRLAATPDPDALLVVARGVGYLVPVATPDRYSALPLRPVVETVPSGDADVLLCAGLTKLLALGDGAAVAWVSARLVADGFDEVRVAGDVVVVRGRELASDRQVEITLDLRSGTVVDRR